MIEELGDFLAACAAANHPYRVSAGGSSFLAACAAANVSACAGSGRFNFLAACAAANVTNPLATSVLKFLSCLRGSELEHSEHNPLIPLQQSSDRPNNPILHFRAKPLINIDFSRALEKGSELNGEPMVDSTLRLGSSTARG